MITCLRSTKTSKLLIEMQRQNYSFTKSSREQQINCINSSMTMWSNHQKQYASNQQRLHYSFAIQTGYLFLKHILMSWFFKKNVYYSFAIQTGYPCRATILLAIRGRNKAQIQPLTPTLKKHYPLVTGLSYNIIKPKPPTSEEEPSQQIITDLHLIPGTL